MRLRISILSVPSSGFCKFPTELYMKEAFNNRLQMAVDSFPNVHYLILFVDFTTPLVLVAMAVNNVLVLMDLNKEMKASQWS